VALVFNVYFVLQYISFIGECVLLSCVRFSFFHAKLRDWLQGKVSEITYLVLSGTYFIFYLTNSQLHKIPRVPDE